ncbi:hypothetical protein PRIPAC_78275 [Pristionchus pacificus]|uniref:Uncharacterized protein n=1 Tax=Pristionchus pacificus TaxID=54126 RepID=A0A2A6C430_PRIPA|nr:hypothetical protein PRIPAC_78275 [Pristionchus pacificus]|eukprot:PDM72858.1 hypothetical protein PRIPAC_39292 [Pristionchus pacificus]
MIDCDRKRIDDCEQYFAVEVIKVYVFGFVYIAIVIILWLVYDLVKWIWPKPHAFWVPPIKYSPYIPRKMPYVLRVADRPFKILISPIRIYELVPMIPPIAVLELWQHY